VIHDDGVELTFDNIVNDSSLYASDVLNRIESNRKNRFVLENRIEIFFLNALLLGVSICSLVSKHLYILTPQNEVSLSICLISSAVLGFCESL